MSMNDEKKQVRKAVIQLAWPVMLQNLLMSLMFLSDTIMLGWYSQHALAAVGLSGPVNMLVRITLMCLAIATTAMVARAFGEKNETKTNTNAVTSLTVALVVGGAVSFAGAAFARSIISLFIDRTSAQDVLLYNEASSYLSITLSIFVMSYLYLVGTAILRGVGDTKTPLKITVVANILNIIGDYILIYGKLGAPEMGVKGAAISTFICSIIEGAVILFILFFSRKSPVRLSLKDFKLVNKETLKIISRISLPAAIEPMINQMGNLVLIKMVSVLGQAALATHHVILRIESLSFMPGMGLSVATSALVGQYLGASQAKSAHLTSRQSIRFAYAIMGSIGLVFLLFPSLIIGVFTGDAEVRNLGFYCLVIAGIEQPIIGYVMINLGTFRGAGDTKTPLFINVFAVWFIRLPLAFIFTSVLHWGLIGIWLTMPIDWLVRAIIYRILYKQRKWQKIRIY